MLRPLILALVCLPVTALAQPAPNIPCNAQGISGLYQVDGRRADGTALRGEVEICETDGRLDLLWRDGDSVLPGAGVREGRTVQLAWSFTGAEAAQPELFLLMPNGDLWGTWRPDGTIERLIFLP